MAQKPHCQHGITLRYHPVKMRSLLPSRLVRFAEESRPAVADTLLESLPALEESTLFRTLGWLTAGLGAVALGLFVGRELRQRYKFNRRTPYDFYAHSGDEMKDMEFGVGI